MATSLSAHSMDRTPQVLETDTATIQFSGGRAQNDSDSDSSSALSNPSVMGDCPRQPKMQDVRSHSENAILKAGKDGNTRNQSPLYNCSTLPGETSEGKHSQVVHSTDSGCPDNPKREQESCDYNTTCSDRDADIDDDQDCVPSNILQDATKQSAPCNELNSTAEEATATKPASRESMSLELNKDAQSPQTTPMTSPARFNPFNKDDLEDQDPFPQLSRPPEKVSECDSVDSWDDDDKGHSADSGISNTDLCITEDYFTQPEGHIIVSSIEDLEGTIAECKQSVIDAPADSDLKKNLVHQLVQLRLKLAEANEKPPSPEEGVRSTVGHMFVMKDSHRTQRYCEQCNTVIWGVLQAWFRCNNCGFCCHEKCLNLVTRTCASLKVLECPEYELSICPEKTLASQNYKCAECRADISFHSSQREPRLCDYNGHWYCDGCHWNDQMILPARVLHNWDFEPKKVCRGTKQYLKLMRSRPVLRVVAVNPMLFNFVEELNDVKKLREEILVMKQYFLSCKNALQSKLLLQLKSRQHFVENSDMYSLHDLLDVANDVLLPELAKIHASFAQHIKTDCLHCQVKGNVCELCDEKEVLFPFDNIAIVCSNCSTVLHRHCYMSKNQICPNCTLDDTRNY